MADLEEKLPMDGMEDLLPANPEPVNDQQQPPQQPRDETGKFAPKDGEPRGKPDETQASRRYAQERDEARREAQAAREAHTALQKRLDDMSALARGEDPAAPKEPVDPLKPVIDRLDKIDQRETERDQSKQAEETHRQVLTYAEQDEATFRTKAPDFPQAVSHYITSRLTEMQALGIDQAQAEQVLQQEANNLLYQTAQAGRSPAEAIYNMAKARGYMPGAVTIEQPSPAPPPPPQNFGGRSFGSGSGSAAGAVTAAQIAQLSEEDYMAFRSTPEGARAIKQAMGG